MLGLLAVLSGCQSTPALKAAGTGGMDNASFMTTWNVYRHCESGVDNVEAMREDALRLARAARESRPAKVQFPAPLQRYVGRYVSEPPHRLAVDLTAMAAACSLHTGHAAFAAGRTGVADEMYRLVLTYSDAKYYYYLNQARAGLAQIAFQAMPKTAASDRPAGRLAD